MKGEIIMTRTVYRNYNCPPKKRSIKNKLGTIGVTLCMLAIFWLIASIIDVDMHNMPYHDHVYQAWNIFELFF
jgi:hypothetical protein